jgi:hypothetical protein
MDFITLMDGIVYALLQTGGIFGRLLRRFGNLIGEVVYGASEVLPPVQQEPQLPPPEPVSSWLPQVLNPIYIALIVAVVAIVTTFVLRFYVAKKALSGKIAFSYEPSYEKPKKEEKKAVPEKEKKPLFGGLKGRAKGKKEESKEEKKGKAEKPSTKKEQPVRKRSARAKKEEPEDLFAPIPETTQEAPSIEAITREDFEERLPDIKEYAKEIAKEEMRKSLNAPNVEDTEEEEEESEEGVEEEKEKKPWE